MTLNQLEYYFKRTFKSSFLLMTVDQSSSVAGKGEVIDPHWPVDQYAA